MGSSSAEWTATNELKKEAMERDSQVAQTDTHLDNLLIASDLEAPWYKSIVQGIREIISPPKLPPLELTSQPGESSYLGASSKIELPWYRRYSLLNRLCVDLRRCEGVVARILPNTYRKESCPAGH